MKDLGKRVKGLGILIINVLVITSMMLSFSNIKEVQAEEKVLREMIIQVEQNIIALPQGDASKVSVAAARFRATGLRELNTEYNAVTIEKLYAISQAVKADKGFPEKAVDGSGTGLVDVSRVFTKDLEQEIEEQGNIVVQAKHVFIIQFEVDPTVTVAQIVNAYKSLSVVVYADQITRRK